MPFNRHRSYKARAIHDREPLSWQGRLQHGGSAGLFADAVGRGRQIGLTARSLPLLAASVEFVVLAAVLFEAGAVYHRLVFGYLPSPLFYGLAAAALAAVFVLQCALGRDHSIKRQLDVREQLRSVFLRWNSAYALWVFGLFMLQATEIYSRGSVLTQYVAGLATALILRAALSRLVGSGLRSGLISGRKTLVIGDHLPLRHFVQKLRRDGLGANVVDVIPVDPGDVQNPLHMQDILQRVERLARRTEIDDIVLAFAWADSERIRHCIEALSTIPATLHLAPDQNLFWVRHPVLARVGGHYTLRLARAPLTLRDHVIKRAFDVAVASTLLLAAAPLLAVIALAIRLETPGPALFRQRRNGFNQREFRVFKFRTMTATDDGDVIRQATRDDPRVTRVGRLLRRTNLDEVPQLVNVILGDMSLVGPRPHAVAHNCQYEEQIRLYARRHNVKPGITGWAQVNGYRGETDHIDKMQKRVEHDLFYIDHWSVSFDIRILVMTVLSLNSYRNAY
jgi:Undecaprenyl-phosphate glucose phosphotransferase